MSIPHKKYISDPDKNAVLAIDWAEDCDLTDAAGDFIDKHYNMIVYQDGGLLWVRQGEDFAKVATGFVVDARRLLKVFVEGYKAKLEPRGAPAKDIVIPSTLEECLAQLRDVMVAEDIEQFKLMTEKDALVITHHGFGTWLRNNWMMRDRGSALHKWFVEALHIWHADDMSSIIFTSLHRQLNGKELKVDEQARHFLDYWEAQETGRPV